MTTKKFLYHLLIVERTGYDDLISTSADFFSSNKQDIYKELIDTLNAYEYDFDIFDEEQKVYKNINLKTVQNIFNDYKDFETRALKLQEIYNFKNEDIIYFTYNSYDDQRVYNFNTGEMIYNQDEDDESCMDAYDDYKEYKEYIKKKEENKKKENKKEEIESNEEESNEEESNEEESNEEESNEEESNEESNEEDKKKNLKIKKLIYFKYIKMFLESKEVDDLFSTIKLKYTLSKKNTDNISFCDCITNVAEKYFNKDYEDDDDEVASVPETKSTFFRIKTIDLDDV